VLQRSDQNLEPRTSNLVPFDVSHQRFLMKKLTTIWLLLLSSILHSQNNKIDSLDRLISKASSDTGRINLMIKKFSAFNENNLDSAVALGKKTIEEAKKINYKKGEGIARSNLASSYSFKGEYAEANNNLKIAEGILIPLKDSAELSNVYGGYGMMYGMQSKYDSAIFYFEKAIHIAELAGKKNLLGSLYQNLSISYEMQSNYAQALAYQQKALKIAEEERNVKAQAYALVNMGNTYQSMGDTIRSEQALLKAIDLAKKAGVKNVELYAYSNLASLYEEEKKFEKSYEFAMKAAILAKATGDQGIESASLSKAALSLARQKKFTEAEELNLRAMIIADSSHQPFNIFQVNSTMGSILKMQGKYREAIPYFKKSFESIKDADLYEEGVGTAYSDLSECYEKTGDFSKALATYKTSAAITDSMRSKSNIRKATELSMNFEFEKKQQLAKEEQEKKNAVAYARQVALLVGIVFTFLLAIVTFYAFRNKQKANALLNQQKQELQSTLTELKTTQAQLVQREKMASLGELTAGIAHEIQNPLNFVNNFSELNLELIDEMEKELNAGNKNDAVSLANDIKLNLEKTNYHGKRADAIVKSMLQHSQGSSGQKEPTDINALAEKYLHLSYHGFRAKDKSFNVKWQTDFDENAGKINIISQEIGRVLLNLFNNAFYSVSEKKKKVPDGYESVVFVKTKRLGNKVEIRVRDNGLGISENVLDKIFQPFFTTKPTGDGTGLGLSLSYDIITKVHGGEIGVESRKGEFAEFIIVLPA
jgi:two-component system NtrC family sensor kinase